MRTKRNAGFWGRGQQPFHAAAHEFLFALDGLPRNFFAGQDEGHEDRLSLVVCQTIAAVHEFFDAHVHENGISLSPPRNAAVSGLTPCRTSSTAAIRILRTSVSANTAARPARAVPPTSSAGREQAAGRILCAPQPASLRWRKPSPPPQVFLPAPRSAAREKLAAAATA